MTSCAPKRFSNLKDTDVEKYLDFPTYMGGGSYDGSPLSYNVLTGHNPLSDYDFTMVRIKSYWFTYYAGDPKLLLDKRFPKADIILSFNNYYYVGYKKE